MTTPTLAAYLDRLDRIAHEESVAEETFRREIVARMAELERRRAFAFRRFNLMRIVVAGMVEAKDDAEAVVMGSAAFMRELDWTGATEAQREVVNRFMPVVKAIWDVARSCGPDGEVEPDAKADDAAMTRIDAELAAFEAWFAEGREVPFLGVMDREVLELPLVET